MSFNNHELDLIEFGKWVVYKSLHEMKKDGDDLNTIQFDYLIERLLRNINNRDLFDTIINIADDNEKEIIETDWREEMK